MCKNCNNRKAKSSVTSFDNKNPMKQQKLLLLSSSLSSLRTLKRPNNENSVNDNHNNGINKSSKNTISSSSSSNCNSFGQPRTLLVSAATSMASKVISAPITVSLLTDSPPSSPIIQIKSPIKEMKEELDTVTNTATIDISETSKNNVINHDYKLEEIENKDKEEEKKEEMVEEEDPDDNICMVCNQNLCHVLDREAHIASCFGITLPKSQSVNTFNESNNNNNEIENENDDEIPSGYGLFEDNFMCVICDIELSKKKLIGRVRHLKRCCKKHTVSIRNLLALIAPGDESDEDDQEAENNNNDDEEEEEDKEENDNTANTNNINSVVSAKTNAFSFMIAASKQQIQIKKTESDTTTTNNINKNNNNNNSKWKKKSKRGRMFERKRNKAGEISYPPNFKIIKPDFMLKPIIVDGFQYAQPGLTDTYFLTHFHADHYGGLDSSFSPEFGRIFATPVTCALVQKSLRPEKGSLIPLEFDREYNIMVGDVEVQVTMLPANHCPGACCILFYFPRNKRYVLHTGDFRWSPHLLRNPTYAKLRRLTDNSSGSSSNREHNRNLTVYLDTTYCDPQYSFPPQDDVLDAITAAVIDECRVGNPLFAFGSYGIGKEKCFMVAAEQLDSRIFVNKTKLKSIFCFDWGPQLKGKFSTSADKSTRVWVCTMGQMNFNSLENIYKQALKHGFDRVVAFKPTGWTFQGSNESSSIISRKQQKNVTLYSVPYSEHSSFTELEHFMSTFRPWRVVPTVNTAKEKVQGQLNLLYQQI